MKPPIELLSADDDAPRPANRSVVSAMGCIRCALSRLLVVVANDGIDFHIVHDGPASMNKKLNSAWKSATNGVNWT